MVARRNRIHGLSIAALCLIASPAMAAPLQDWRFDPETNQLEVTVQSGVRPRYSFRAAPARIVLELPSTEVGSVKRRESFAGAVRQITVSEAGRDTIEVVLELAPTTVLEPRQLEFRQVIESDPRRDRWVLRPLIASAPRSEKSAATFPPGLNPGEVTPSAQSAPGLSTTPDLMPVPGELPKAQVIPPTPSISQLPTSNLPLPDGSFAIPEVVPRSSSGAAPTVTVPPLSRGLPQAQPQPLPQVAQVTLPQAQPQIQPQVQPARSSSDRPFPLPDGGIVAQAPSATPPPNNRIQPSVAQSPRSGTIEFGQPLSTPGRAQPTQPYLGSVTSPGGSVLLSAGTQLSLRYPGFQPLRLQSNQTRQETLELQNEIRDRAGNLLAPIGSAVLGRFENSSSGSRFVAQAISIRGGVPLRLIGQSDVLSGARQVSEGRLLQNSGIGALAGALLGGLSGGNILGGAAVGAGVTYAFAPRPATIQPGQILQIRLVEDLLRY